MKKFFNPIVVDRTTLLGFVSACIFSLLSFIFILISYKNLPPFIPIFNQLPWGDRRLGETPTIFIPLLLSFFIILSNLILAALIYPKYPLVSRIVIITSTVIAILVFLFFTKTITLVT